jgi:hypothetical protein
MVVMRDLWVIWPDGEKFMPTRQLVGKLIMHNPDYWSADSAYGKPLTEHRLGKLVSQAAKVTSSRIGGRGPRGYVRVTLEPVWHRLGIGRGAPGASGESGESGAEAAPVTACTGSTGCTGSTETPIATGAQLAFTPPAGPDRCPECGWHMPTQGHRDDCSANEQGQS